MEKEITLREFLAVFCADIDIFLLQDEKQEKDNDKVYTASEIREHLHKSFDKFTTLPDTHPGLFDTGLFSSLSESFLSQQGYSEKQILQIRELKK